MEPELREMVSLKSGTGQLKIGEWSKPGPPERQVPCWLVGDDGRVKGDPHPNTSKLPIGRKLTLVHFVKGC